MSAPTPAPGDDRPREGYYPDPSIPGYVRYWNGASWVPGTSRPAPKDGESLTPPPGARPAAPSVEETGPHFFDEDPQPRSPGQERMPAWGTDPRIPADRPSAPAGRTDGTASIPPAQDDAPDPGGTFIFRRPVPGPAAVNDDGTMTFRPVPGQNQGPGRHPGASGPAPSGTSGTPGTSGFGAQGPVGAPRTGPGAAGGPSGAAAGGFGGPGGAGPGAQGPAGAPPAQSAPGAGPGFGAGKAAAARAAAAQASPAPQAPQASPAPQAPHASAASSVPQQAVPQPGVPQQGGPQQAVAPGTPVTAGPGGGQASWAQQVHQLAGGDEQMAPWKPPVEDLFQAAARRQASARPAGLGRRFAARLIDNLVLGAVTAAAAVPFGAQAVDHVQHKIDEAELSGRTVTVWLLDGTTGTALGIVLAVLLVFGVLYEVLPTAKWGRTLGKKLCGIEVRDIEAHEPPTFGAALRRWLVYSIPGLLGIGIVGVLWCLFDRPWHQCWHDKAAHTFVAD
ncbi:RDD family protein [Streptomyces sp. NPDC020362]|uniref:RDD family protein n=1 Tax=unclassified Streptomyces TaxID=2593676 RepID=UPI0033E3D4C1